MVSIGLRSLGLRSLVLLVLAVPLASSAVPAVRTATAHTTETTPASRAAQLTPDGAPYQVVASGSRMSVYSTDSGSNNREIYWNADTPDSPGATQCATWTSGSGIAQNGMAFRIAPQSGGYNAVVFSRNIWLYQYWIFAPKMFHTGSDYDIDADSPPGIDLGAYLGRAGADVWPLRICASLSADNVLRFVVAKGADALPPLSDPGQQGGSWKLDMATYYHPGEGLTGKNGGTFAGHIPIGTSLVFDDTTLDGRPAPLQDSMNDRNAIRAEPG